MKKITTLIVLAALCLNFPLYAQFYGGVIKPVKTGETVPDLSFPLLSNNIVKSARLSDYRGKLVILDFWATWCAPCVMMIPKMDSLQKQFAGKVVFIPVSSQPQATVTTFMKKLNQQKGKHYDFPEATGDTTLVQMFPHSFLPHYVWIDQEGVVRSFTEFQDVNAANISKFLESRVPEMKQKIDAKPMAYIDSIPFLMNGNGGDGSDLLYHSVLTPYKPGLGLGILQTPEKDGGFRILGRNMNPLQLMAIAGGDKGRLYYMDLDEIKLDVADTAKINSNAIGQEYDEWLANGHGYCYELKVPASMKRHVFEIMRAEIQKFFPDYTVSFVPREKPCMVLESTGDHARMKPKGGTPATAMDRFGATLTNRPLRFLVAAANMKQVTKLPWVDRTGYKEPVTLTIRNGFDNLDKLNKELAVYGLTLKPGTQTVNEMHVSDKKEAASTQTTPSR
ncbi:TlpA family protein disulfide reductase [Mucilaginibacter conchicola]|uniref:TlpA family protein disulfide reductase n=1 Tax=Mucilaginibacter conchicola TaxID=2303333 RepID=A0A372NNB8_9SPHI|nr:TlpA disulfide reductase family protein [Mucilaginibacter conchicola]RFZ90107.1 TlpA family protein disulfide reductase [Mucilaginibacter conchicola]